MIGVKSSKEGRMAFKEPLEPICHIPEGSMFKGLLLALDLRVSGSFCGKIKGRGHVWISRNGSVQNCLEANEVTIEGTFEGIIIASKTVRLMATSVVKANIFCNLLLVEEGASLNGSCDMDKRDS